MKLIVIVATIVSMIAIAAIWVTQPLLGTPNNSQSAAAEVALLRADVRWLTETFPDRNHTYPKRLELVAGLIQERFISAGAQAERYVYQVDGVSFSNVIARFGPQEGRPIVVGAHYDVEEHTPGADDNASGVAGLLEIARLLGKEPPKVPVELVAYTLEEPPFFRTEHMGSRHHALRLLKAGVAPRLVVVLEMIGYFDDRSGSQAYPFRPLRWIYPDSGNFIAVVGSLQGVAEVRGIKSAMAAATHLPVWSVNAPTWMPGLDFSDHASYWLLGMPAVMVTDTAFYRNHRYHRGDDRAETLDYRRMAQVVQGVLGYIRQQESEDGR
jgi:hypothetical protein